jgi:multiple sugar transport system ATP-binding protein
MATVTLDQVSKRYVGAGAASVDAISLEIADGEFMVLLGPSGCGKTTTLRMIAGLESISGGVLSIDGRCMNAVPAKDRDIAMVFQSYALYPHMTVAENLSFGLKRRSIERSEIERRIQSVAETLGLAKLLERKPHALSGGQRQRVALGRAIVRDPKVFLFDEPLSNLDAALRVATRAEITRLHRALGATMIYVTHDQVEAMTMGTRICIMNGGRIAQVGRPLDVYREPADVFVAGFLGNPAMNLIPGRVSAGGSGRRLLIGETKLDIPSCRMPAQQSGTEVTLGIRPENVALEARSQTASVQLSVSGVETLGAETMLALRLPGLEKEVVARIAGSVVFDIGALRTFHLDLAEAHVFDRDGKALKV